MSSSPISLPKGGGSVSGLGEKFSPDLFTGTGNFSVPIALPPGRNGFQPELGLQYSTGSGNTPFGLGWNLSVPGVMRKTAKGIPQYDDEKDTFILSGAEDLVAVKKLTIKFVAGGDNSITNNEAGIAPLQGENGIITQYRPRTEGLFARVYHLKTNLRNCWKVMSKNGLTSWYGSKYAFDGDLSLVQKPDYPTSIFAWKLTLTEDTFGSPIIYTYDKEQHRENEYHIWDQNYLKEIQYADYQDGSVTKYMVRVLFNYEARNDAFSDYKSGFDIRTTQRCRNIQIFTNPTIIPATGEILTRTYHFQYSDEVLPADQLPYNGSSLLCKVEVEGHDPDNGTSEFLPPLEFRYTHFKPKQQKFRPLKGKAMPLSSLANPGFELIDLFGNAMPDIVEINGVVRYWRNMGNGTFDEPRIMKNAPTGVMLGDPDVQLLDANGDGRTDLMVNGTNLSGYFSVKYDGSWDTKSFKKYDYAPSFSFADPEVKMLDLTGDGITDVLRNGNAFECFFQDKDRGWVGTKQVQKRQLAGFPNVSFADPRVKLADMTGDGMQDIVLINSGSIKYWANLGYGNFAKPVVMKNAPRLPQSYDPARLQLADIDGDGQADLIFVDANKITFWINQSGNGWSEPFEIAGTPFVTNINGVRIADIYGSGVSGVLYSFDAYAETQRNRWFFLDLTGGTKPYLLHEMDNNMGALTRVSYQSSTRYYLKDQYGLPDAVLDAPVSANETPAETALWKPNYAKRRPWKTTLPFPVQVVSRVDVIDELSKGKLSTRYLYHHGYWDGGEREFRGFGRVDQQDTETFERYNAPSNSPEGGGQDPSFNSSFVSYDGHELQFDQVGFEFYSPPTETRNWFHLGPVGDEFGEWFALDFSSEYWSGDPSVLQQELDTFQLLQNLPRRAKRDALRAWRGSSLRSELYALDEQLNGEYVAGANGRPYTVSESQYGIRVEAAPDFAHLPFTVGVQQNSPLGSNVLYIPKETSGYVFFSFATSSRTTQWERGSDPMAQFSFTADYDAYGQARKQLSAALPRGIQPPYTNGTGTSPADEGNKILSTISVTSYASPLTPGGGTGLSPETYIVDRSSKAVNYEVIQQNSENVFALKGRVLAANLPNEVGNVLFPIIGFTVNYYDAPSEFGAGLSLGTLGKYGALARTETLVLTDAIIQDAYVTTPLFFQEPLPNKAAFLAAGYPEDFYDGLQSSSEPARLGYIRHEHSSEPNYATGWYAESGRTKYDWQDGLTPNPKGLVLETKDVFGARSSIEYDDYLLLPVSAKQFLSISEYLETKAEYDYRVLQAWKVTDPNGNRAVFGFSPLGLLKQSGVIGKEGLEEGDIITESPLRYKPSVLMEYDFFAFINNADPVWVKTIQREQHYRNEDHSINPNSPEIIKVEYTDGFGRLLQTRTQAEDVIFGDPLFGNSGLPEQQGQNGNAVGIQRGFGTPLNVVVSGWKIYNNKGKVVEQYEPFFDKGFDYSPPFSLSTLLGGVQSGAKIKMYYDPRGNVIRTVNPDNSEQWVIYGKPNTLSSIAINNSWSFKNYTPTPWESYTYDADDLAPITNGTSYGHDFTPKSATVDALGRTVKTVDRLSQSSSDDLVMKQTYDIQGNVLTTVDSLNRIVFRHKYGLAKQLLWKNHLDSGISTAIADATGKPIEANDAKGARVFTGYDEISRPLNVWAKDNSSGSTTLRQVNVYGESLSLPVAKGLNLLGKIYQAYDEAGLTQLVECDFKGNPLEKFKQVISDDELVNAGTNAYTVDWTGLDTSILDSTEYHTNIEYDALNRGIKLTLPAEIAIVPNPPHRSVIEPVFNNAGALEKIKKDGTEYVKQIAYNAKGQQILAAWNNDVMIRFAYDKKTFRLNRVKAEKYTYSQSGNTHTYAYNSGTTRYDQRYIYDLIGNVLGVSDQTPDCGLSGHPDQLNRLFEYDALYRLLKAKGREENNVNNQYWTDPPPAGTPNANNCRAYTQQYEYDKVGNIQNLIHTASGNNWTRHYNYQSNNNKLNSIDDGQGSPTTIASFTYDNNGNQITANSDRFYEWNYADRMRCFYIQAGMSISKFAHYLYDAGGQRTKKLVLNQSGGYDSVTYIDGVFEYHKKVTISTTEEKNYIQVQGGIEIRVGGYSDDDSETTLYTISDHLSSAVIRLITDGSLYDKEEFYPYGETSLRTFGKKRYRFTGKERDNESGLYYYGARYYCSGTTKFLSVDPKAGEYAHQSSYCYADCNPVVKNDPSGMGTGDDSKEAKKDDGKVPDSSEGYVLPEVVVTGTRMPPPVTFGGDLATQNGIESNRMKRLNANTIASIPLDPNKWEISNIQKNVGGWEETPLKDGKVIESATQYDAKFENNTTHNVVEFKVRAKAETMMGYRHERYYYAYNQAAEAWQRLNVNPHVYIQTAGDKFADTYQRIVFDAVGSYATGVFLDLLMAKMFSGIITKAGSETTKELPNQIHHFATNKSKTFTPRMAEIADEFGLNLNGAWNKQTLPHLGRHPNKYHKFVLNGMENARTGAGGSQAEFLNLFNQYVKQPVIQNPGLLRKSGW